VHIAANENKSPSHTIFDMACLKLLVYTDSMSKCIKY